MNASIRPGTHEPVTGGGARRLRVVLSVIVLCVSGAAWSIDLPDFSVLARTQGVSVVNINATRNLYADGPENVLSNPDLPEFLQRLLPEHPLPEPPQDDRAVGSGFIISADGYILTNAHVVDDAASIEVRLHDKRTFLARLVGADSRSDVALIKIEADELQPVRFGEVENIEVGDWVIAIGSPFGFENSVTAGIVSAQGRVFPQESYVPFIQTDVAINPGNSGGPLFNLDGEVIGVNSQIYSRTGGFMGVSFAIPIDIAMDIQAQLRAQGEVRRGRIGVSIQAVTPQLAHAFGLQQAEGALVGTVEPGSPAHRAGMRTGDVVLRFDTRAVRSADDLPRIVGAVEPGREVDMTFWRDGVEEESRITVGQWASERRRSRGQRVSVPVPPRFGLELVEPTGAQLRSLGARWGLEVIASVGPAGRAQIVEGDLLVAVISQGKQAPLRSIADFDRTLSALAPGESLSLLLQRGPARTFVTLSPTQ